MRSSKDGLFDRARWRMVGDDGSFGRRAESFRRGDVALQTDELRRILDGVILSPPGREGPVNGTRRP